MKRRASAVIDLVDDDDIKDDKVKDEVKEGERHVTNRPNQPNSRNRARQSDTLKTEASSVKNESSTAASESTSQSSTQTSSQSTQPSDDADTEHAFHWNAIRGLNQAHSIKLSSLFAGSIKQAVLLNYCWDVPWLLRELPVLANINRVHFVSGQRDYDLKQQVYDSRLTNITVHLAKLPIPYGCHHTKMVMLFYDHGVRVIVMTANFLECDVHYKNQAIWHQDFPIKQSNNQSNTYTTEVGSDFERTLKEYFSRYRDCGLDLIAMIDKYDFSSAKAVLLPTIPGAFVNESMSRVGHLKVRHWLTKQTMDTDMQAAPVVAQFSSLGSLTEKWMNEFALSFSQHAQSNIMSRTPPLQLVWPRVVDVQWSIEGWAAGGSLCCDAKNVKPFVASRYHRWDGLAENRHRAMPHIKSYSRAVGSRLGFAIIGSANLSAAAWGALQKDNKQISLRHYEMGVLVAPFVYEKLLSIKHPNYHFSCTPLRTRLRGIPQAKSTVLQTAYGGSNDDRKVSGAHRVICPFPYDVHPKPYAKDDVGWTWDTPHSEADVHGMEWRGVRAKNEE